MKREKDTRMKNMHRDAINLLGRLKNYNQEKSRMYQKGKSVSCLESGLN